MSDLYIIGLDCDGVLYAWEKTARYMLRRKLMREGRTIPNALRHPSLTWDTIQQVVSEEDWKWLWTEGVTNGLFRYGHGYPGFIEGAQALCEMGDLVLITSRPKQATNDTLAWLHLMFDKVMLGGIRILSHSEAKSTVEPHPNIFIDDALHNVEDIVLNTEPHVRAVLFDQPWNAPLLAPEFPGLDHPRDKWARAIGWDNTVEAVKAAKEGKW